MKYIANYDTPEFKGEQRSINLAGVNVMKYMSEIYNQTDHLDIISPSRTLLKDGLFKRRNISLRNGVKLHLPFTFGVHTKFGRIMSILYVQLWLFTYLLCNTSRDETVIVYHSAAFMQTIKLSKFIKRFKLILEVREIYANVNSKYDKKREISYLQSADKYIFATKELNEVININNKPYVIAPGIYQNQILSAVPKFNDGKIHLVYAGNLSATKGGAYISIDIAKYLGNNYVIHVLGSGSEAELKHLNEKISINNSQPKHAKVIYEGVLRGESFNNFLQRCDIGLSTQNPSLEFNNTSFPSKILTYLANGIEVVSANIPAVTNSAVGEYIHYYHEYSSEAIAKVIIAIEYKKNTKTLLEHLNNKLESEISQLLK